MHNETSKQHRIPQLEQQSMIKSTTDSSHSHWGELKDINSCQVDGIKGLTDKVQFKNLIGLGGLKRGLTCIKPISLT